MNFELNEDEEMLKAVVERFVLDRYDVESRRTYLGEAGGFSAENWALLAELGVMAVPLPEDFGGLGLDATALAVTFEALGRGIVVEPVLESAVLPALILANCNNADLAERWIGELASGEKRIALAHAEANARSGSTWIETRAVEQDGSVTLDGSKAYAIAGGSADAFLVSARFSGNPGDADGWSLFLVPADATGLRIEQWRLADGTWTASLDLSAVTVGADARIDCNADQVVHIRALASLARSAEALGIMEAMFAETLDYIRTREQFGTPLGTFQVIQHRMADQYAALEQSRALIELATVNAGEPSFARHVAGARAFIAETSLALGHEMIQMHGGMGVTDELSIGQGHKRLLVLSRWPEPPTATLDRFAAAD
ncbi:acyl-CoA dehydrogenase [Croceicoccus ponticola]|uniref:Acyl-CoA dehydrogenase n=1 Tax=Croceicoccus ponticola TaxID=2217664 RepID=A0A437GWT1_9SPHN|nr:acyl-CoA dehydrogenase family protein [Croceicoccus ponticola]RVQ66578.1 acyl-CoA dehydrogenase [Croceicoccus ponticola]